MTVRTPDSGLELLEQRYERLAHVIVYVLLAVPLIPYVLSQKPSAGAIGITAGVAVAAAAWVTWMDILHPEWLERRWLVWVYVTGLVAFIAVLTIRSPWYAFFTWIGFLYAFRLLTGAWRWVAAAVVAVFFAMAQDGGFHRPTASAVVIWLLLACVDVGLVGFFIMLGVRTDPVVRDGLRGIFEASGEFEVVGEAANGREAVDRAAALRPDVVLMDLRMPVLDGVSAIRLLAERGVTARVLVLTTFDTDTDVVPAIEAGATGYLMKDSPPDELLRGVRAAARGEAVLSPSVATRLLGQVREPAREPLSQRELDILALIARGCSNREAAARLFISEATVKTHVLHVYAKLGVNDRAAAVAAGFERGLLPRP